MNNGLSGQFPQELFASLSLNTPFRSRQVFKWIHSGAMSFQEMTNLPKQMISELSEKFPSVRESTMEARSTDQSDGSEKLTITLSDGLVIESVMLVDGKGRKTACLSSQVGCAMGCVFCRTGTMGLVRNLMASEIVEQFLHLKTHHRDITHIVFMGMGEPLANFDAVMKSIEILHHPEAHNISYRRITISTCGIADGIRKLADAPPVGLALSLVTAKDTLRDQLMPINRKHPIGILRKALKEYQNKTKKRVTIEYVLMKGCNDSAADADALADFTRDLQVLVNLIPWNPVEELPFKEPSAGETEGFAKRIEHLGIAVSKRMGKGRGINGACGQLAAPKNPISGPPGSS